MAGGAFFDLDRTVIARSSSLALAPAFRERGLIGRGQVAKAMIAQLVFTRFGSSSRNVGTVARRGIAALAGASVADVRALVADTVEPSLLPLVYRDALDLVERHRERGEPSYLVSAALQEIVDGLVGRLGLAGGVGTRAVVVDGVYTGAVERALHGEDKAEAFRSLAAAEGLDPAASTAYSDSHTDLAFLEAAGTAVAVNPDRTLRTIAEERGWTVLRFDARAFPAGT